MRKIVFVLAAIAAGLMMLAATGPYLIPSATYRAVVGRILSSSLDANVAVGGFRFRLIPYPGYTIRRLKVSSIGPPFDGKALLEAKKVSGSLSPAGLLRGEIRTSVKVRDADIYLRFSEGASNIDALIGRHRRIPQGLPSSGWIEKIIARTATAAASEKESAGGGIAVRSLEIVRGRVFIFDGGSERKPFLLVDNMDLAAGIVNWPDGSAKTGGGAAIVADFHLSGSVADLPGRDVDLAGRVSIDAAGNKFSANGLKLKFARAQFVADLSIDYGAIPLAFDIQASTPAMSPEAFAPLSSRMGGALSQDVSWKGTVAAAISAKGVRDDFKLEIQTDATRAQLFVGELFSKEPGLPLKFSATVNSTPGSFSTSDGAVIIGEKALRFEGELARGGDLAAHLVIEGSDLDSEALKSYFLPFAAFDAVEGLRILVSVDGGLLSNTGPKVGGEIAAGRIGLAGIELADIKGAFVLVGEKISFTTLKGTYAGGALSGNGFIRFGKVADFEFDAVAEGAEAKEISCLADVLSGKASIVVKAASSGADPDSLAANLKLSGTFVLPSGALTSFNPGEQIFGQEGLGEFEAASELKFDRGAALRLVESGNQINDLRSLFEVSNGKLLATDIEWQGSRYAMQMSAAADAAGNLDGRGNMVVAKSEAAHLLPDSSARGKLLDWRECLAVPVSLGGTLKSPAAHLDRDGLARLVGGTAKLRRYPGRPGEAITTVDADRESPRSTAIGRDSSQDIKSTGTKGTAKKPQQGDAQDIFRVIIGD